MLTKQFIAKTKTGIIIEINATNTEKKLVTNYKVECVTTKQGRVYVIELNARQAKDILNVDMPKALVVLDDQKGWKQFEDDCLRERYEIEEARPKTLAEQREALSDKEYNTYSPEYFPGSKGWQKWDKAYEALKKFDEQHPEVKESIKKQDDGFIPTEGGMDL